MNRELNDIDLVRAALAGDNEAFSGLVNKHYHRIYCFILKNGISLNAAEDLAQEVFLQAYKSKGAFQERSAFSTWLYGIARNIVLKHFRQTVSKRKCFISSDVLDKIRSKTPDPCHERMKREDFEGMFKKLNELPEDLKEVLTLVFFEELSYAETAKIMKIPEGTVKSKIHRARKSLKKTNFFMKSVT